jgi:hypothetical protein
MKKLTLLLLVLSFSSFVHADDADMTDIKACLKNFGKHPFNAENPQFDVLKAKVKVLGIGGTTVDDNITKEPKLILIKPNVTVLSKTNLNLLNPNGWYCLKGQVSVLGKAIINLHCTAKITSSSDGVTVLGGSDGDNGVTVLGKTKVVRVGCDKPAEKAL